MRNLSYKQVKRSIDEKTNNIPIIYMLIPNIKL